MSFLPPVVMEMRANASQFLSEQGKVVAAAKTTATETEKAAQKEAAAARTSAAEATRAAEQKAAASDSAAKAAVVATDRRIAAEVKATEAQAKAAQIQADSLGAMTKEQQVAYDKQVAAAERAANAVSLAAAKESEAQGKAAASATVAAEAQSKAADLQVVAAEKSAAAQEVAATRTKVAMNSVVGVANKVSAVTLLAAGAIAVGSVEMASKFEKSTMLLVTAGGESVNALESVRQGILDVSTQTGTSAEQMSEGMYVMEKAGIRGAAGLSALKMAAEGAKDENVDLSIMTQALTDLLLDYGTKTSDAAAVTRDSVKYTNELVAASGAAKTTMTDFAGSMSAIIPIGSTAKISFEQLGGAIATMTQHGQTAQQSSQNLANLVMSLVRPNNLASAAMSQLGIDTTDLAAHLGERGLSGTLAIVDKAIKDHMTPDLMVHTGTMKDNANAAKAMDTIMSQMSPTMAKLSQGLKDGSVSQKSYTKDVKDLGGEAGALGNQFMTLYKANSGVTDSLKAGKPAYETYTAALRDTLGNVTAMRAAQMLLMNDGREFEANIKAIGEAGKKTGQDISTWADMQSTLSVKMDQTKAMVENLGIELGSKLVPVAKDAVQGFTDLFHGFEKGNPVLLGIAGLIGGALLISTVDFGVQMGKTVVKTVSGLVDMGATAIAQSSLFVKGMMADEIAVGQFSTKAEIAGAKVKGMSGMIGGIGAVATGAVIGLELASSTVKTATNSIQDITTALKDFADAGNTAGKIQMDALFSNWDKGLGHTTSSISGMDDAIQKLQHQDFNQWANHLFDPLNSALHMARSQVQETEDKITSLGSSLGQMASNGSLDTAARGFDRLAKSWGGGLKGAQDLLDKMPDYKKALEDQSNAVGHQLSQQEELEFAMGKIPDAMVKALNPTQKFTDAIGQVHPITPALQKSLDDAGVSADGLANDLTKVLDGMLAAGLATENSRTATEGFNKTINDAHTAVDDLTKQHVDLSNALNDTSTDFNLADAAGAQLNDKFTAVKDKGIEVAKSLAGQGKEAVSGALVDTYNNMIKAADGMGIHGQAAIDLTRNLLGIPKNVDVKTWVDTAAAQAATDKLQGSLDKLPTFKSVSVNVQYTESGTQVLKNAQDAGNTLTSKISNMGGAVSETMGFWDGGVIPGTPPSNPKMDNILTMVNGKPLMVRSGEFITNEPMTKVNMPWLKASNAGLNIGSAMQSRYASGYAQGASQAASYGQHAGTSPAAGRSVVNNVDLHVQTNATAPQIVRELGSFLAMQG
ncbi:phage tail tape measure protein [Arthrobacter sp. efr-133-TYG-118]|uniref:phage tail tape measure protein n=1 Tax=Arthrobacter sp. efr-133-TYG-118 TaxID=3040279 RepID=UPI00254D8895|nr:phage tail tape measure protein [Arthrobacter sp. efr-133-TYG-118]